MLDDGVDLGPALRELYGSEPPYRLTKLRGDASTRSYFRLQADGAQPTSLVVMQLPPGPIRSDEVADDAPPAELPFLDVQRFLHSRGVDVPTVYAADVPGRVLLLEDLGDDTFEARLMRSDPSHWPALYGAAVDLMCAMHTACAGGSEEDSVLFTRRFDHKLLRWELDHFRQWGLEELMGPLSAADRGALDGHFDALTAALLQLPVGFVHRDYQSRNLMWVTDERLTVIDFQDALLGPVPYDLVALLCDSYVPLEETLQEAMVERYIEGRGLAGLVADQVRQGFWLQAVQRKLKDAGRFLFIDRVRANPDFLVSFPQSIVYVDRALRRAGLSELRDLLNRLMPGFSSGLAVPAPKTGSRA